MRTNTIRRSVIALGIAGFAFGFTACGNATETGVEKLIESQSGGDVDLDLNGDGGFSVQTEEGGMSIDEDGNFVITDANGSVVTGNADSDTGDFVVESEDGSFSSGSTTELPEEWPTEIPEPDDLAIASASVIASDTEQAITVTGTADDEGFVESYGGVLQSAGFDEQSTFTSGDTINNVYTNDEWTVGVIYFGESSESMVTISVYSNN
jgi:hypothetical protein